MPSFSGFGTFAKLLTTDPSARLVFEFAHFQGILQSGDEKVPGVVGQNGG